MMFDQICMSDWSSAAGATCEAEVRGGGREREEILDRVPA